VYTCTISDTNVTTSIIVAVSGSIRNPIASLKSPETSHAYTSPLKAWPACTSRAMTIDATNAAATPRMHSQCETLRPIFGPHRPTTIDATSGANGTSR
jgi:hypothetical protein